MNRYNILIVEDDPIIGILLVDILIGMGHGVCALKTTAESAVAAAAGCNPDLMLVDVQLGSGSGIAAVAEIQRPPRGEEARNILSGAARHGGG
jgi:CheY-like chemotaxis protein